VGVFAQSHVFTEIISVLCRSVDVAVTSFFLSRARQNFSPLSSPPFQGLPERVALLSPSTAFAKLCERLFHSLCDEPVLLLLAVFPFATPKVSTPLADGLAWTNPSASPPNFTLAGKRWSCPTARYDPGTSVQLTRTSFQSLKLSRKEGDPLPLSDRCPDPLPAGTTPSYLNLLPRICPPLLLTSVKRQVSASPGPAAAC